MYIHGILFSYCAHLTNASSWMYKIIRTYQSGQHCSQLILSWPFWSQRLYFRLKAWELKLYNKVKFLFSNHDCFVQELHVTWWTTMAGNSWLLTGDDNVPRAITTLLCARISAIATLKQASRQERRVQHIGHCERSLPLSSWKFPWCCLKKVAWLIWRPWRFCCFLMRILMYIYCIKIIFTNIK